MMRRADPVEMPDHRAAAGYDDRAPTSLDNGLRHFDCTALDAATHKGGQHLNHDRAVSIAAV